jgi:hypothetical protein
MLVHKETEKHYLYHPIPASGFPGLTQVCHMLRCEYLLFVLSNIQMVIDSESVTTYAMYYDRKPKDCETSLCVFWEVHEYRSTHTNLLPLLLLMIDVLGLAVSLIFGYDECMDALDPDEERDLTKLLEVTRENASWRDYLVYAIDAVTLHSPENRCAECEEGKPRNARLHIVFKKEQRELWMDGTHNFAQLRKLLAETGLDKMTAMDVRVGLTSLGNEGLGKGLRTEEEQQAIDWMLGRSKKRPSDIKRFPRMLQELGE